MGRVPTAIILGLLTAYLLASALSFWPYTVDDAFISLRYAQNLVDHGELAWNLGERVEGFSNPLWTMWSAIGLVLGVAIVPWLKWSGVLCALALVPSTYGLARVNRCSRGVGLVAAAIVATNASVALWSVAGLETASFALVLVLFALRFEVELRARAEGRNVLPISAVLWILVWTSRPEAPAYGLYLVVRRFLAGPRPAFGRADAVWLAVAGLPILAHEVFGLVYFGGLVPSTHSAKLGGGPPLFEAIAKGNLERFLAYRFVLGQGPLFATFWLVSGLAAIAAVKRLPAAAWAMGVAGLVFIAYAFTDWMPRYRFFVPPLPFFALAHAIGLAFLVERVAESKRAIAWGAAGVLVALGAWDQATRGYDRQHNVVLAVEPRGAWPAKVFERAGSPWDPGRQELDAWFALRAAPKDEWIVCPDIGFIGALARNPIWDLRGLVTPKAAAFLPHREGDPGFVEARRAMLDEMFELDPAYIFLPRRPQGLAPVVKRFKEACESDPRFAERYAPAPPFSDARLLWVRKRAVAPFDVNARIDEAMRAFPTYDTPRRNEFAPR